MERVCESHTHSTQLTCGRCVCASFPNREIMLCCIFANSRGAARITKQRNNRPAILPRGTAANSAQIIMREFNEEVRKKSSPACNYDDRIDRISITKTSFSLYICIFFFLLFYSQLLSFRVRASGCREVGSGKNLH